MSSGKAKILCAHRKDCVRTRAHTGALASVQFFLLRLGCLSKLPSLFMISLKSLSNIPNQNLPLMCSLRYLLLNLKFFIDIPCSPREKERRERESRHQRHGLKEGVARWTPALQRTVLQIRQQVTGGAKIFAKDTSDRQLSSKMYKEFLKCNSKK